MTKLIKSAIVTLALGFTIIHAENTHNHTEDKHTANQQPQKENNHEKHGHAHHFDHIKNEVSKEVIEQSAMKEVQNLVAEKKISNSWKHVPISKIGKTHYGDTDDWVVGFDNVKIKNKERQTLYIFVGVQGKIRGANYTGN